MLSAFSCPSSNKYGLRQPDLMEALAHQLLHFMRLYRKKEYS